MKSIPKLIRRFVGIMILSIVLLVLLNAAYYAFVFVQNTSASSPWDMAERTANELCLTSSGYSLPDDTAAALREQNIWAILIDDGTHSVIWQTDNLPEGIPSRYSLSDIALLTRGYVDGYPTFTGSARDGLLVLGYPRDRFWKHTRASWDYAFIANLPRNAVIMLAVNAVLIFLIYAAANFGLLHSVKPLTSGIQDLSDGVPVCIRESGPLSGLARQLNQASDTLQKQAARLRKRDTARANWIAGISHDVRTPLSMIMGYAGQLEDAENLTEAQRKKAAVIVRQSRRMRDLISDLNLASRLEYDMQPLSVRQENAVAIVRQVVVDYMNMAVDDRYPIEWNTADTLSVCPVSADPDLLRRAVSNLIQNSISHNEDGCAIYVSVDADDTACRITVEDSGVGASDEQIGRLNRAPHDTAWGTDADGQRHGLGLLIVRQILRGHHGEMVTGHSGYGGLKVVLTLPK